MQNQRKSGKLDKKGFWRIVISALIITLVVIGLIIFIVNYVKSSIYNERKNTLSDTTKASAMTVNTAIDENKETARILTNVATLELTESGTVEEFVEKTSKKMLMGDDMFFVVDASGRYFSSDGKNGVLADLEYYTSSTDDEVGYLSTLPHLNQKETYLIIRERLAEPIEAESENGIVEIKYCAMMFDLKELNETVSSLFPGVNNTFIYESTTGTMLYKQFNIGLLIDGYNVYPKFGKGTLTFGEKADEMVEKCKNRETVVTQIEIDGNSYYVCSAPIDVSDWSLMFILQKDYIDSNTGSGFSTIIYIIVGILLLFALAIMMYVVISMKRKAKSVEEKNQMIINALSEDFESVVFVEYVENKLEDTAVHYRRSERLDTMIPGFINEPSFSKLLDLMGASIENSAERQQFISNTRREVIIAKLKNEPAYYVMLKLKLKKQNEYFQIQFSSVFDGHGKPIGFVAGIRSIDAETREKMTLQENLEKALQRAEDASAAKTRFLFNMSHDIRTPMNAIMGFTNMAAKNIDNKDKVRENLGKIQKSSDVLLTLINDILEMSRIENGTVTLADNKCDITGVFEDIIPLMNDLAASKKITIDYKMEEIRDKYVHTDKLALHRVLMNLISNSVKYTNNGGWVKVTGMQLVGSPEGFGRYRFIVEDNGMGMSDEFQKHLFEEFAREKTEAANSIQGTGLGLALVKSLTELMGGTVTVESKLGIGSKFTVEMSLKLQSEEELVQMAEIEELLTNEISLAGKRVLLVEDNEFNREIATSILEDENIVVTSAEDGSQAVDALRKNGPEAYDFILMDIQMPVMNGYEAAKAIRSTWPDSNIVIIALSANAFEEDKLKSKDAGMNDHISKPINVNELLKTIRKYM